MALVIAFLSWILLYYPRLPVAIQSGDTSEIVVSAELGTVLHPPGYPLITWLLRGWNYLMTGPSPYWESALFFSFTSMFSLFVLFLIFKRIPILALSLLFILSTSKVFWKYSVLPDVFSLHWLLALLSLFVFLSAQLKSESRRLILLSVIFGLSFANHHTTAFLAPLWIYQIKVVRRPKLILTTLGMGAGITAFFYLSIFFLDRFSMYSWGYIESISDLWRHFSRSDYGTFKLTANDSEFQYWKLLKHSLLLNLLDAPVLFVALLATLFLLIFKRAPLHSWLSTREWTVALSWLFYMTAFLSLSNIHLKEFGIQVFERFTVMPFLLLLVFSGKLIERSLPYWKLSTTEHNGKRSFHLFLRIFSVIILLLCFTWGFNRNLNRNDYSERKIVQEYIENLFRQAPNDPDKKTIFTAMNDSVFFGIQYVLALQERNPNWALMNVSSLHKPVTHKKLKAALPNVELPSKIDEEIEAEYSLAEFVAANSKHFHIFVDSDLQGKDFGITYLPAGRLLSHQGGTSFLNDSIDKIQKSVDWSDHFVEVYSEYDHDLMIYSRYANYYLAKGLDRYDQKDFKGALKAFEKGLEEVPFCHPCLANKCLILSSLQGSENKECFALLARMTSQFFNYYRGEPFNGAQKDSNVLKAPVKQSQ